jgi:hypothetical protein
MRTKEKGQKLDISRKSLYNICIRGEEMATEPMDVGQMLALHEQLKQRIAQTVAEQALAIKPLQDGVAKLEQLILTTFKGSNDTNALVKWYIDLRDAKADATKAAERRAAEFEAKLEDIAEYLRGQLHLAKCNSIATDSGTYFKASKVSCTVGDKDAFLYWVKQDIATRLDYVDARAAKTNIAAMKADIEKQNEARKGAKQELLDPLPPGINWHEEETVNIRRANAK